MANQEIMRLRGRLAQAESLMRPLENGINVDIDSARVLLDKYEPKERLKGDELVFIAERIRDQVDRYKELQRTIAAIKEDLGE